MLLANYCDTSHSDLNESATPVHYNISDLNKPILSYNQIIIQNVTCYHFYNAFGNTAVNKLLGHITSRKRGKSCSIHTFTIKKYRLIILSEQRNRL